jgi:predicted nucleic acid-binding Zn ribbon protein
MDQLSKQARDAKNEYQRQWKKANKDKVKQYNINYWEKQVGNIVTVPVTVPVTVTVPVIVKGNTCVVCNKPFEGKRVDSKYCSDACKMKHHREIKRNKVG